MSGPKSDATSAKSTDPRRSYSEEDIQALIVSPRFLVAVDAYGLGRCSLEQMLKLAFTEPPYIPRGLHPLGFAALVFEVVRRIRAGEVWVPDDWRQQYEDSYVDRSREWNDH
jgi:hypothetical protein